MVILTALVDTNSYIPSVSFADSARLRTLFFRNESSVVISINYYLNIDLELLNQVQHTKLPAVVFQTISVVIEKYFKYQ